MYVLSRHIPGLGELHSRAHASFWGSDTHDRHWQRAPDDISNPIGAPTTPFRGGAAGASDIDRCARHTPVTTPSQAGSVWHIGYEREHQGKHGASTHRVQVPTRAASQLLIAWRWAQRPPQEGVPPVWTVFASMQGLTGFARIASPLKAAHTNQSRNLALEEQPPSLVLIA